MARFERIALSQADWSKIFSTFDDRIVFQSAEWQAFLRETQRGESVIAELKEGGEPLGYFTGMILKKFGLRVLGSPIPGSSTPYQGFNLRPGVSRRRAAEAMPAFAFGELRCAHFEVVDPEMTEGEAAGLGFTVQPHPSIEVDLTSDEETIFNRMDPVCRRNIRKAEKGGVVIEQAAGEEFAMEFAAQLQDVYAKQGLVPNYGESRVRSLIRNLEPSGQVLLLRARNPEGRCIATGIYPAVNHRSYYWGGASWRDYQALRPNELLHWTAMKLWRQRGIRTYNMVGNMPFKKKFGGVETVVPLIAKSRNPALGFLRRHAPRVARTAMHLMWRFKPGAAARVNKGVSQNTES
jgi:CelD/BcsL family acetyltransferase involved in cellulose biosynthesis